MAGREDYFTDISSNNPIPNLRDYKAAGHIWLARKVSEGVGYHWFEGDAVADEWHALGGHVFHYHWFRPDADAHAQTAYFLNLVAAHWRPGDFTMNDWERSTNYSTGATVSEPSDSEWAARGKILNDAAFARFGRHCVYTGNWYINGRTHLASEIRRWPVILSDYTGGDGPPDNSYGFKILARQFTDRATVPGLSRPVDYNRILNHDLLGGTVSATGPEKWDDADFAAVAKAISNNRSGIRDALADLNGDALENVLRLLGGPGNDGGGAGRFQASKFEGVAGVLYRMAQHFPKTTTAKKG